MAQEFNEAPEVTQRRLYLETIEKTLGDIDKIMLDEAGATAGQGVLPYLPLNELRRSGRPLRRVELMRKTASPSHSP